ncbi:hypothetical protein Metev_1890 [Methanohalobium evestigatum Z-7303]|uniref:Uncharacterized protein n=1 Tax=Methanohalobium evestigatum (strain ATCC BAA-1072 / DSM 3721 / NBRC 107634 / OCM 161 / Z-7303) TaxID=644295 RepID=D7EA50_METEZ|nr:hypothetical protein [Methanohalobium evestigatum]ADI74721.1 hypothetical protein Metev_1890 [Methanohalobium evestigatum Z-7303]
MNKNGMYYESEYFEKKTNQLNLSPFMVMVFIYFCLLLGLVSSVSVFLIEYFNLNYPLSWEVKLYPLFLTVMFYVLRKEFQGIKDENDIDESKIILLLGALGSVIMVIVALVRVWALGNGIRI